jgi:hypothetical protein
MIDAWKERCDCAAACIAIRERRLISDMEHPPPGIEVGLNRHRRGGKARELNDQR